MFRALICFGGFAVGIPASAQTAEPYLPSTQSVRAPKGFEGACRRYSWLCSNHDTRDSAGDQTLATLKKVNWAVNRRVVPLTDRDNYGRDEFWTLPDNGRGDCEDYAMAKYKALLDQGVPSSDLSLAVVLDRRRQNHVVLVVRTSKGDVVLDNMTNRVDHWKRTGYTFLARQAPADKSAWRMALAGPQAQKIFLNADGSGRIREE